MKKVLLLTAIPFALASCAPTIQQEPVYTKSQTYTGTCTDAMAQLNATAIRTKPAVLFGSNTWTTLRQTNSGTNSATYVSTNGTAVVNYGVVTPLNMSVTVQATCKEADGKATLTLASSGQQQRFIDLLNDALIKGITLPQ